MFALNSDFIRVRMGGKIRVIGYDNEYEIHNGGAMVGGYWRRIELEDKAKVVALV